MATTKISLKGAGFELSVECAEGTTCSQAIKLFEEMSNKVLSGMDFYSEGKKITNLEQEAPKELVAVKSKNASAATTTISLKGAGFNLTAECEEGSSCKEVIATFERLSDKVLSGMDFYAEGKKITDLNAPAPKEIVAVKSKNASAKN